MQRQHVSRLHSESKKKMLKKTPFNLAQHLVSETDVESLIIPKTLIHLVKKFLVTYSGTYVIDRRMN